MKLTVDRKEFLAAAAVAAGVAPKSDVKQVLKHIRITAADDRCTLAATDLERGVVITARGVRVDEPGDVMLPAELLTGVLGKATGEELTIEADLAGCVIREGLCGEFDLPNLDPAEFPAMPEFGDEPCVEVLADRLALAIRRTAWAPGDDPKSRYGAQNGIACEVRERAVGLVGTDGHCLAVSGCDVAAAAMPGVPVLPVKSLRLLEHVLPDGDGPVRVRVRPNDASFRVDGATVTTRLVEGHYPNWRPFLPKKFSAAVPLVAGELLNAVRKAAVATDDLSKRVMLNFTKGTLTLSASRDSRCKSKVVLPIEYSSKAIEFGVNPKLLISFLALLDAAQPLTFELTDGKSPGVFRVDETFFCVIVPMYIPG